MQETVEIEVFRADTKASRGITAADIAQVAEFDCEAHPVAGVIGHPKSESEADAEIVAFRAEGSTLFATLRNFSDRLVDKIRKKKIINRSMAFFAPDHEANPTPGKWAPRHLGFLGAAAPGIPGMSKLANAFNFDADDDLIVDGDPATAVIYAPADKDPTPTFTVKEEAQKMDETPEEKAARLEQEEKALKKREEEFNAREESSRKAANKTRVDALVTAGKVLPADKDALELVFNALGTDELEFSADDKGLAADKLSALLMKGPKVVDADGKQISPTGEKRKTEFEASGDNAKDTASITAAAQELMEKDKTLTFEAAVEKIAQGEEA